MAAPPTWTIARGFLALENCLRDAVVWSSLLDKVVEGMEHLPNMSETQVNVAFGELYRVKERLQKAIERMDTIYHQRTEEEVAR